MADFLFNIAKGRGVQMYLNVDANSPSGCKLVVMAINRGTATDGTMKDYDTFSTLLGDAQVAEVTNSGYARKVLAAADLAAASPDDTNNRFDIDIPDPVWASIAAGTAWTDIVIGYDASGAGTDSGIVPITNHAFTVTPNGNSITGTVNAAGFLRVS